MCLACLLDLRLVVLGERTQEWLHHRQMLSSVLPLTGAFSEVSGYQQASWDWLGLVGCLVMGRVPIRAGKGKTSGRQTARNYPHPRPNPLKKHTLLHNLFQKPPRISYAKDHQKRHKNPTLISFKALLNHQEPRAFDDPDR